MVFTLHRYIFRELMKVFILATLALTGMMSIGSILRPVQEYGVGCIPMILIGIGLSILKKGGHLLSAFGISCVPAAVLVVCLLMGKNIATNPKLNASVGIMLIWLGVVILVGLMIVIYRKLLRN